MEVSMLQLPPGDPGLIDKIVCQLKSNGIFDQFRKECIADVDTKPAYQNLRQRVEGSVSSFLTNQEWRADLNKNQLRDSLRKNIHESGFLDIGVERIVDQVVNPKIYTVFFPKVEDVVYGFLGVEKPKKGGDIQNGLRVNTPKFEEPLKPEKKFVSLKDLLPTDLDPISPEKFDSDEDVEENSTDKIKESDKNAVNQVSAQKVKVKEEITSDIECDHDEDEKEDEEDDDDEASPPFESLETDALDTNATPPVLSLHSADMLDNITSSSSSSETKDLLQYGEVRKRYPDPKSDFFKKEIDGEVEKHLNSESFKAELGIETFTVKKEEREKKENLETGKESKKLERREEKIRDNDRKDEARSRKSGDSRDKHGHEKKQSDKDQVVIKQEKDESKRSEKEDQRKTVKDEHRKNDEHKKSEKDEHRKTEKDEHKKGNKDEHRKSEKDDHKKTEKEEHKKSEREEVKKDELRKGEKADKKHGEKIDKEKDSSRRHDKEKEERKSTKEKDEKDKKRVREKEEGKRSEKDEHRKSEKDESRKIDKERSDNKKRDKKDEKKTEKEKEDKKVSKEKDDVKKSDKDDIKKAEKEENKKVDKEKDKHRSGKDKTDHGKSEKDTKERIKSEHKEKEVKHISSKLGMETPKKEVNEKDHHSKLQVEKKKEDKAKKSHHRESNKNVISKDKKVVEKEKKVSIIDDHRHERVKGKNGHRRSDRDKDKERERSQADGTTHTSVSKDGSGQSSSTSSTPSSEGSKGSGDSSSGSGGSERAKESETKVKANGGKEEKQEITDMRISEIYSSVNNASGNLVLKIKKPKIAANIYEVKKIIQVRKNLKKLERERLASSYANKVSNQIADEAPAESASTVEDLSETKVPSEPPKVKRAKLGAVEQDLRVEVESVLEKSLLDDEDGEIGEVHYLENDSNLPDFVLYVRGLAEEAAMGDYSRVPSPTNSVTTAELSDFEDNVILSDVELSKEEEDVVTRLGGCVERKSANLKSPKKPFPVVSPPEIGTEGSNKRPRRPNPRYSGGEYTVYSDDDDDDVEDDMIEISQKKVTLVDGIEHDHRKTPKEIGEEEAAALPTPENDAGAEDRETPVLSKRNQAAAEERRRMGRRLGIRGPLRRVAGFSPGTPDNFVMPLSPESDVSTASGDAGKKASLNTKALENQYHQDVDGELGPEDFDDVKGSEDVDTKHSRLPLGPPSSSDSRSHASDLHLAHNQMGQPSSVLMDGNRRIDDPSGMVPRRLRGTRSSVRVQQRYSSDDLYKPRPNITLGRRNRGRNSPTQDESSTPDCAFLKQGRRGSNQESDELLIESCPPNKRRRR